MASTTGAATEGSDRTPMRSPAGEEEEAVTPIHRGTSIGSSGVGVHSHLPPAASRGSALTPQTPMMNHALSPSRSSQISATAWRRRFSACMLTP